MQEEINTAGGTTERVYAAMMSTLSGAWDIMKSKAIDFGLEIFDVFDKVPHAVVGMMGQIFGTLKTLLKNFTCICRSRVELIA